MIYGFAELKLSYLCSSSSSSWIAGRGGQWGWGRSGAARVGLRSLGAGIRVCLALQRAMWTAEPGTWVPRGLGSWGTPGPSLAPNGRAHVWHLPQAGLLLLRTASFRSWLVPGWENIAQGGDG